MFRRRVLLLMAFLIGGLSACKEDEKTASATPMPVETLITHMPGALAYTPFTSSGILANTVDPVMYPPSPAPDTSGPSQNSVDTEINTISIREKTGRRDVNPFFRFLSQRDDPTKKSLWLCPDTIVPSKETIKRCDLLNAVPSEKDNLYLCLKNQYIKALESADTSKRKLEKVSDQQSTCPSLGALHLIEATVHACPAKSPEDSATLRACVAVPFPQTTADAANTYSRRNTFYQDKQHFRGFNNRNLSSAYVTCLYEAYRASALITDEKGAEKTVLDHQRNMLDICMIREGFAPKRFLEKP